ncbi:hypothetical protein CANMA_005044 [Candida margitis]|uniref:uncharacterized protein n=1 Tax=Candida margitis TaxID=1775924 RepID=UPI002227F658|nr:uncharacterized protein CANMA_005044 [Candida margitis]KAI5952943.1 hypothetical protein CANMA_005044 [Candida margitis]
MDSFEVASQFSTILRNLTPQQQQLSKAIYFALKNADKEDYIVPTLLSVLEDPKLDLNLKSFIFQFIDLLMQESFNNSRYNNAYIQSLKSKLPQIVESVCPLNNSSNLMVAYTCLCHISTRFKVDCEHYKADFQTSSLDDLVNKSLDVDSSEDTLVSAWKILLQRSRASKKDRKKLLEEDSVTKENMEEDQIFNIRKKNDPNTQYLTKKQIITRIEDDRETHKRLKENKWCVNRDKGAKFITENEFINNYWNKCHPLTSEENAEFLANLKELNGMVLSSYKDKQF